VAHGLWPLTLEFLATACASSIHTICGRPHRGSSVFFRQFGLLKTLYLNQGDWKIGDVVACPSLTDVQIRSNEGRYGQTSVVFDIARQLVSLPNLKLLGFHLTVWNKEDEPACFSFGPTLRSLLCHRCGFASLAFFRHLRECRSSCRVDFHGCRVRSLLSVDRNESTLLEAQRHDELEASCRLLIGTSDRSQIRVIMTEQAEMHSPSREPKLISSAVVLIQPQPYASAEQRDDSVSITANDVGRARFDSSGHTPISVKGWNSVAG
jgi:hypothetical protein